MVGSLGQVQTKLLLDWSTRSETASGVLSAALLPEDCWDCLVFTTARSIRCALQ
jgi:hypothetical protein